MTPPKPENRLIQLLTRRSSHVLGEIPQCGGILASWRFQRTSDVEREAGSVLRLPAFLQDAFAQISELLECGVRCASVTVDLSQEEVKERLRETEGVGNIPAGVFVYLLAARDRSCGYRRNQLQKGRFALWEPRCAVLGLWVSAAPRQRRCDSNRAKRDLHPGPLLFSSGTHRAPITHRTRRRRSG